MRGNVAGETWDELRPDMAIWLEQVCGFDALQIAVFGCVSARFWTHFRR